MIRLTEQERRGRIVKGSMEGYLEQKDLKVLTQALEAYGRQGIAEVVLVVDGLLPPDPVCCQALAQLHRGKPEVKFCTSRSVLRTLLAGYGLEVELWAG